MVGELRSGHPPPRGIELTSKILTRSLGTRALDRPQYRCRSLRGWHHRQLPVYPDLHCRQLLDLRSLRCGVRHRAAVTGWLRFSAVCQSHVQQSWSGMGEQPTGVYRDRVRCAGAICAVEVWGDAEIEEQVCS